MKTYCRAWRCDTCNELSVYPSWSPWGCVGCNKEICDNCTGNYLHCKDCDKGKTDEELMTAAEAVYMVEYDRLEDVAE